MNALAVTAHHDDSALWMGGALLRTNSLGWQWHVVYACSEVTWIPRHLLVNYFVGFCQQIGVEPYVLRFMDYIQGPCFATNQRDQMEGELLKVVAGQVYDLVFTHNLTSPGEYWDHANHFEVAHIVQRLVGEGKLVTNRERMVQFSYLMDRDSGGQKKREL